jgi:hypothetical protein
VGHALRSSGLLGVEASLTRFSQSGLKTGGGKSLWLSSVTAGQILFQWLPEFSYCVVLLRLCCAAVDESLQEEAGISLESPDQKTRGFVVQIALPR